MRQPYDAVEDIPGLDKAAMDAVDSDALMYRILTSTRFALHHSSNLKTLSPYNSPLTGVVRDQLRMFGITHSSVREIIKVAVRNDFYPLVGDALSLAREQVEKIFIIATLLEDPTKGFKKYIRNLVKTEYQDFLLQREEQRENQRFADFLKRDVPKKIETMRRPAFMGTPETFVSKYALRVLRFDWNNPKAKNPKWLRQTNSCWRC